MKLDDTLRLDKAEDPKFDQVKITDGVTGVWVIEAPLPRRDANILGCGYLADNAFDSMKLNEEIEDVNIEFTASGDRAPFELSPEKIGKPIIRQMEGGLQVTLRVHVRDGHVNIINSFFQRPNPAPFSLLIRPLQASLFADAQEAPASYKPNAEDVENRLREDGAVNGLAFSAKNALALITVEECEGGWRAGFRAAFSFRHAKSISAEPAEMLAMASEHQAIAFAAAKIHEFARGVQEQDATRNEKQAAKEMVAWASAFMDRDQLVSSRPDVELVIDQAEVLQ